MPAMSVGQSAEGCHYEDFLQFQNNAMCAQEYAAQSDEELKKVFDEGLIRLIGTETIEEALDTEVGQAFNTAQIRWRNFRDANCYAEGLLYKGGPTQPTAVENCNTALNLLRTASLLMAYGRPGI